jgi:hypothetical protein
LGNGPQNGVRNGLFTLKLDLWTAFGYTGFSVEGLLGIRAFRYSSRIAKVGILHCEIPTIFFQRHIGNLNGFLAAKRKKTVLAGLRLKKQ